jgi:catalase-peroxidase
MDEVSDNKTSGQCPVAHGGAGSRPRGRAGRSNRDWWPEHLSLTRLSQHSPRANPMGEAFDYAEAFKTLDLMPSSRTCAP